MSTTQVALTAHIVRDISTIDDHFLHKLCKDLEDKFGIVHPTIQIETGHEKHLCEQAHPDSL